MKRLRNIKDANEKQLQAIRDELLKLVKRIKDEKPKLKSLRHQIDKRDQRKLEYFDKLLDMETAIDYTKLNYQPGNKIKMFLILMNFDQCLIIFKESKMKE